jgi:hypothetical protein
MTKAPLSDVWEQHVLPSQLNHVLVSDADGDAGELIDLATRIATPSLAEVTLCCQPVKTVCETYEKRSKGFPTADALREKSLTVHIEPAIASEMQRILLVDRSRSVDLIIMREHETIENANWYGASSIDVARKTERPVIACGPLFSQIQTGVRTGPVLAAVSTGESSHQIVDASGHLGKLMGRPLMILHAVDISHEFSRPDNLTSVECECQLLGNWIGTQNVATAVKVAYGPVSEVITRFAAQVGAELIVMGIDLEEDGLELQRSDVLRRFVLMAAKCPVLLLPTFHGHKKRLGRSYGTSRH